MRKLVVVLFLSACAHHGVDPAAHAPQPWPAVTTPPAARMPEKAPEPARHAKDAEIPEEGAAHPFVAPKPQRAKLACGAELLVVPRHNLPLVALDVVWKSGAAAEPVAFAGLATLTTQLLDQGAGKRDALAVAAELERLGARLSTAAGWDGTTVALTTLTRALDPSLAVLADVVLRPRFDDAEIARVRKREETALLQLLDNPSQQASLTGGRALYGAEQRYGQLLQGTAAGLDAIDKKLILAWHAHELAIGNATVIAVGDVELKPLKSKLDRLFGGAKRVAAVAVASAKAPALAVASGPRVLVVDKAGAAQTEMHAVQPGPNRATPDYFPLVVLNQILGGSFSSRLNSVLREKKGYTYGARSGFAFRREGGPFDAGAPVKTAVTGPALADLRAELQRATDSDVTDLELAWAKKNLQRSLARSFETPPEVASSLAIQRVYDLPSDYYATYGTRIDAVTVADLRRAASTLQPKDMTLVFVGDEKVIGPEIKKALGDYQKLQMQK